MNDDIRPSRELRPDRGGRVLPALAVGSGILAITVIALAAVTLSTGGHGAPAEAAAPSPVVSTAAAPAPSSDTPSPAATAPLPVAPVADPVLDAQAAYDLCVAGADPWDSVVVTPQGELPPAPTTSLASFEESEADEQVEGTWTVVIPVVREHEEGPRDGIKVCTITGSADAPEISVTDSLD
ncbi:hypothetical protein DVJ78_14325 [Humibacter sp. BT305]|nr:hypothetical protein DVJ78_14325 [Humibacter sp. BT305]